MAEATQPSSELARILELARRLGIELNENDALQWLTAMAAGALGGDIVMDTRAGVFGHRVTMLDFSPAELAYFRRVGHLVEFQDEPGVVETALALSGLRRPVEDPDLPGRLRLLRAGQHPGRRPRAVRRHRLAR